MAPENGGNCHQSHKSTIHCDWGNPNLYLDQPITRGWCQPIGIHVSHSTDSPTATRLGLCSRLHIQLVVNSFWLTSSILWLNRLGNYIGHLWNFVLNQHFVRKFHVMESVSLHGLNSLWIKISEKVSDEWFGWTCNSLIQITCIPIKSPTIPGRS